MKKLIFSILVILGTHVYIGVHPNTQVNCVYDPTGLVMSCEMTVTYEDNSKSYYVFTIERNKDSYTVSNFKG